MVGSAWDARPLLDRVRLSEDPSLGAEIVGRLPAASEPRAVSVTDLLSPRRAFWRRLRGPAPVPLEREARMELGRAWHRRLGHVLAADGTLEVHLRSGGLTGRIDLLADVPVEIKTGAAPSNGGEAADWPEQVAQLAVYCALVGSPTGRLAHLAVPDDGPPTLSVGEFRFRDLAGVVDAVRVREAELRTAILAERPGGLPPCAWLGRGCEFRTAGICDCRGDEVGEPLSASEHVERRVGRPDLGTRWLRALETLGPSSESVAPHFRDLLYPRRAFYDRTQGRPPAAYSARPPSAPLDPYERTIVALERGAVGEVHRLRARPGAPEEDVLAWRGAPCLIRSSRVRPRLTVDEVKARFSQYLLDLGLRCGATGVDHGTLIVSYDAVGQNELPVQVFRTELSDGAGLFATALAERSAALGQAISGNDPAGLPSCPDWMVSTCPYRATCACGPVGRSQR